MRGGIDKDDPFAIFFTPPLNETVAQRTAREAREVEEQLVSDRIDNQIKAKKSVKKKERGVLRMLLLGQSESGAFPPSSGQPIRWR